MGLVGLGLVSEMIYLVAAVLLPWWRYGGTLNSWSQILGGGGGPFVACLAGIGVLMAAYWWGGRAVRDGARVRGLVWGFTLLFTATLFWLMPITSDLFDYLSQAHLFTDLGANPLADAPLEFAGDRLLQAYPTFYGHYPSIYGPMWALLSALGTLGLHDVAGGLFYLKGLAAAAFLGCAWLLEQILQQTRPASALKGLYLFAWNPLVLLMAVGDGHNDIVMMAVVLLAFWLLMCERWTLAFGVLAFSVWIKYVSVIFFPLFVFYVWRRLGQEDRRAVWPGLARGALAVMGVSILVFVPFWRIAWLVEGVERLLRPINWHGNVTGLPAWVLGLGVLLFAIAYVSLIRRFVQGESSFQQLMDLGFVASLLAFLFGAARSQPWHLIWPVTLAGLSQRRWAWPVVAGLSAVMLTVQVWVEWGTPGLEIWS